MNFFKRVAGHVYFLYAILVFIATMLVILIPAWITSVQKEPRKSIWLHNIFRVWMGIYLPLVFVIVKRKGKKNFEGQGPCVVVCNHNSFADIPVTSPWIPGPNKTLAKAEMASIPLFGLIYRSGSILLDRKDEGSRRDSFNKMEQALSLGLHLCLFPEGTRNKTAQPLQPFYDGAFVTAIRSQRPIIPALLFHTRQIFPGRPKAWAMPMTIPIHFLEPIPTAGLTLKDTAALKQKVKSIMEDHYISHS